MVVIIDISRIVEITGPSIINLLPTLILEDGRSLLWWLVDEVPRVGDYYVTKSDGRSYIQPGELV